MDMQTCYRNELFVVARLQENKWHAEKGEIAKEDVGDATTP